MNLPAAQSAGVPVFRRVSGGAAVVAGPGCLMYALLLSYQKRPHLRMLDQVHQTVMDALVAALEPMEPRVGWLGTCDVVVAGRKVSGNSLRCRRDWLVYHGTLLLDMDLALIDQFLLHPPREPEYRQRRKHTEFVANLGLPVELVIANLAKAWNATPSDPTLPHERIQRLVDQRYQNRSWNFER